MVASLSFLRINGLRAFVNALMLCLLVTKASYAQDWQLKKDEDGIKVYTGRTPNSNFKSVKVECTVNAHLAQLIAFLLDVDKQHDWVYSNKTSRLVRKVSPAELIFYSEVSVPWPASNRDYISHINISQQTPTMTTIDAHTEPDLLPEVPGKVRVKSSHAHWEITTLSKFQQQIVYTVQFDPAGALPAWLVNMFVTRGPLETFQKLKKYVANPEYENASLDFIKE
jgi:hypothetical protein